MANEWLQDWDVKAQFSLTSLSFDIMFFRRLLDGTTEFLQPPDAAWVVRSIPPRHYEPGVQPTLCLGNETVRNLIEAAQQAGVQPQSLTKIEGQFEAQTKHLGDLQRILTKRGLM